MRLPGDWLGDLKPWARQMAAASVEAEELAAGVERAAERRLANEGR